MSREYLNTKEIRKEFSLLGSNLVYLDNAVTTFVPDCVLNRMIEFYKKCGGSPGRVLIK